MSGEFTSSQFQIPEAMFRGKHVLVSAYMSSHDVDVGSQGDSPTIKSLMGVIEEQGGKADYLSYCELGATGLLIRFMERLKKKSISNHISGSHTRWMYTASFHFLTHVLSRIDILMRHKVMSLKSSHYDIYIFFYPYLFATLKRQLSYSDSAVKVLFEANVERRFFEFQFSKSRLNPLKNLLVKLVGIMETKAISRSDAILTVALRDAKDLRTNFSSKRIYTLPLCEETGDWSREKKQFVRVPDVLRMKDSDIGPDTIKVTFVGSNYSLNVQSVEELIGLARKMSECKDRIKFIVVGNVNQAFDDRFELPDNIIFTGYLRDFDDVMSASDYFVLFDYMGTGIESKSRIYSHYPGLTLALTNESEEYLRILKEKLISFDCVDSMERFLRECSFVERKYFETVYPSAK